MGTRTFTLVELMIVVAIIAILAAIAIPQMQGMMMRAKRSEGALNSEGIRLSVWANDPEVIFQCPAAYAPNSSPDKTAVPWVDTACLGPGMWSERVGYVPDGEVRCVYKAAYTVGPEHLSITTFCNVDGDGVWYWHQLDQDRAHTKGTVETCLGGDGPCY